MGYVVQQSPLLLLPWLLLLPPGRWRCPLSHQRRLSTAAPFLFCARLWQTTGSKHTRQSFPLRGGVAQRSFGTGSERDCFWCCWCCYNRILPMMMWTTACRRDFWRERACMRLYIYSRSISALGVIPLRVACTNGREKTTCEGQHPKTCVVASLTAAAAVVQQAGSVRRSLGVLSWGARRVHSAVPRSKGSSNSTNREVPESQQPAAPAPCLRRLSLPTRTHSLKSHGVKSVSFC